MVESTVAHFLVFAFYLGTQEVDCNSMPRSATIGSVTPSRCTPVCGTLDSVKAAYTLLATLCDGVPNNFKTFATNLLEVFYTGACFFERQLIA